MTRQPINTKALYTSPLSETGFSMPGRCGGADWLGGPWHVRF